MKSILTERCELTPLSKTDFDEAVLLWTNKDVRKYLGKTLSAESALRQLNRFMWVLKLKKLIRIRREYIFVVRQKDTSEFLGMLFICPHHELRDKEISYMFLPQYWRFGYATETLVAVLEFCKMELKLKRIVSETQTANNASCRLLEKLGYRIENEKERFGAMQTIYVYDFL